MTAMARPLLPLARCRCWLAGAVLAVLAAGCQVPAEPDSEVRQSVRAEAAERGERPPDEELFDEVVTDAVSAAHADDERLLGRGYVACAAMSEGRGQGWMRTMHDDGFAADDAQAVLAAAITALCPWHTDTDTDIDADGQRQARGAAADPSPATPTTPEDRGQQDRPAEASVRA